MKKFYKIIFALLFILMISCNKESENKTLIGCDSTNTLFNQLYNNILNTPTIIEEVTLDLNLHSYTFEVTSPATICKIGYRSQPSFESFPYLIEIYNNTTSSLVYSSSHTFLSSTTEYVSINPVILNVGDSYTIKRTQNNLVGDANIYIGRLLYSSSGTFNFPFNLGILKITGSSFNDGSDNSALPYIDIVFE